MYGTHRRSRASAQRRRPRRDRVVITAILALLAIALRG